MKKELYTQVRQVSSKRWYLEHQVKNLIFRRNFKEVKALFHHFKVKHRLLRSTLIWRCSNLRIRERVLATLATMNRVFMFAKHKNVCEKRSTIRWQESKNRSSKRLSSGQSLIRKISKTTKSCSKRYLHQVRARKISKDSNRRKKRRWLPSLKSNRRMDGENKSDLSHSKVLILKNNVYYKI